MAHSLHQQAHYSSRLEALRKELGEIERVLRVAVVGRIIAALLTIVLLFLGFDSQLFFYALPLPIFYFIVRVRAYTRLTDRKVVLQQRIKWNENEIRALSFDFSGYADGSAFKDEHHVFSFDLDLFGPRSLFQAINRCATALGEKRLALDLLTPTYSHDELTQRQQAIRELGPRLELRESLWSHSKTVTADPVDGEHLRTWLSEPDWVSTSRTWQLMRWLFPAIVCGTLVLSFFRPEWLVAFLVLFSIQWTVISMQGKRTSQMMFALSKYNQWLASYATLFERFSRESFAHSTLVEHHTWAKEAHLEMQHFSRLVNRLESRMNALGNAFGNGMFAFDLHAVASLERWRAKNGVRLPMWLESMAHWDALNALAHFHFTNPDYAFAEYTARPRLEATQLGHPLIPTSVRVGNDVVFREAPQVMIITGANMAGKSTFLRTVGVNFVLSRIGAPVCAASWKSKVLDLRTGMRTTDSLQDHQSYFYAELKRLEQIVADLRAGREMLVLLDEILKGTNSDDKQAGSQELILQLTKLPALTLIATHDVQLGALEQRQPSQIIASCFETNIRNSQLHFDYLLRKGVAQTRNATFLMKQMGIIPDTGA